MTTDRNWLIERAGDARDPAVFAVEVLRYLVSRANADLGTLELHAPMGERSFFHVSATEAIGAEEAKTRMDGAVRAQRPDTFRHPFTFRHLSGLLCVDPVRAREVDLGRETASALTLLDILTELARASEEAASDPLTGLANRRSMGRALGRQLAESKRFGGRTFSLALLDLDNFKWFNDTYGHPAGDDFLREMGAVLRRTVRAADLPARWGGDEFLVLLPQTDPQSATFLLDRIGTELEAFMARYAKDGTKLGFSAGIAYFPADGDDAEALIETADRRLYAAKPGIGAPPAGRRDLGRSG